MARISNILEERIQDMSERRHINSCQKQVLEVYNRQTLGRTETSIDRILKFK